MKTVTFIISFALLLAVAANAADRPPAEPKRVEVKAVPEDAALTEVETAMHRETPAAPARELSPMMAEIQATMDAAKETVAELNVRYRAATDQATAHALVKEVARVKHESRVQMMRIQLRYALEAGRADTAGKLEEAIAKMTAPPRVGQPQPRPIPERAARP